MSDANPAATQGSAERKAMFGIVCGSHLLNHFQSSMVAVLYPLMMKDLGFGYVEIGFIAAAYGTIGQLLQGLYGFIVPRIKRAVVLGAGNIVLGLSVLATGFAPSYPF
ncbi:MAG: MFS transporter, partial [Candidatus Binatia bacterium]